MTSSQSYCVSRAAFFSLLFSTFLVLYSLIRLLFYLSNADFFSDLPTQTTIWAFIIGLRFDLSSLVQINLVFILLYILPKQLVDNRYGRSFLKFIFVFSNVFFLFLSLANTQYFPYVEAHLAKDIIYVLGDAMKQFSHFVSDYWWLFTLFFVLTILVFYGYTWLYRFFLGELKKQKHHLDTSWKAEVLFAFIVILVATLSWRGGLQPKVLSVAHAHSLGNHKAGILALNAPFTFIASFSRDSIQRKDYFANQGELQKWLRPVACHGALPIQGPVRNIFVIILESFGAEFVVASKPEYTPTFHRLASDGGALFMNVYANAQRSIQSLLPILSGLPNWLTDPIVKTRYINNKFPRLGSILKKRGYRTLFLHGGHNGTMYFDSLSAALGIDEYYGYNEFPTHLKQNSDDGAWGIFDEPFFLYTIDTVNEDSSRPFFAVLFSLSAHHPFVIPKQYKNTFPKGETPLYESIAYTDHALGSFFSEVKKQKWAQDTLFVLVADHAPITSKAWSENFLSRRRVPLLLYRPGHDLSFLNTEQLGQQLDIFPTVLDFLGISPQGSLAFGRSLVRECEPNHVILFSDSKYWLIEGTDVLLMPTASEKHTDVQSFILEGLSLKENPTMNPVKKENLTNILKAHIQHFNNGMLDNDLVLPFGKKGKRKR